MTPTDVALPLPAAAARVRLAAPLTAEDALGRVDARTFAFIVQRDRPAALSLALRICVSRPLAEDVVQEAMFSAWRDRARYDPLLGSTRTWLLRIVRNRAIDAVRHDRSTRRLDVSDDDAATALPSEFSLEAEAELRDQAARLRRAFAEIPVEQRHAIELSYLAGLSHAEIAGALGLSLGTVKGRIRLGLARLRAVPDLAVRF